MFASLSKTFSQLRDPRLRSVLLGSIGATLALIAFLGFIASYILDRIASSGYEWLDSFIGWAGTIGVIVVAFLFLPGMVQVISGLFLERVASAVEAKHYPHLGPGREQQIGEVISGALKFAFVSVALNILALPLYLLLPGFNLLIFYGLNGYLLGREYMEMVAGRRIEPGEIRSFRKRRSSSVFLAGVVITAFSTIPILNLATPVLATAFMLHEYERLRETG